MIIIFGVSVLLFGIGIGLRIAGKGDNKPEEKPEELHPVKYHEMKLPIKNINAN